VATIYFTERKSYEYDEVIQAEEKKFKDLKKEFEKTHEAIIKKSLTFKQVTLKSNK
jgi:hypothetical protein